MDNASLCEASPSTCKAVFLVSLDPNYRGEALGLKTGSGLTAFRNSHSHGSSTQDCSALPRLGVLHAPEAAE